MPNADRDKSIADEPTQPHQTVPPTGGPQDSVHSAAGIDLNHASESEIAEIDFIGKKIAHAIVERRTASHGFQSWDDLRQVPGLDAKRIAELQRAARLGSHS